MRTKTLLLIAAVGAAGVATSMAQVFSVNAVGYVNKTIPKGQFALISNPLKAATNTINALFQPVHAGFQVYVYTPGKGFDVGTFDDLEGAFLPATVGNTQLLPGQGVFVKAPSTSDETITFVGEVVQGTGLTTPLVPGLQIVSSQVPQEGTAADLGLPHTTAAGMTPGDQVYQFTGPNGYYVSTFDDLENNFIPALKPLAVGEAIFVKVAKANSWKRDFSVNP
jgi:hypothetical protein